MDLQFFLKVQIQIKKNQILHFTKFNKKKIKK